MLRRESTLNKIAIFGNSGSGKSTLAKKLCAEGEIAHLDLDTVAWKKSEVPERNSIDDSMIEINKFTSAHDSWVIEGCYSDLLEIVLETATEIIFLNLPVRACIANAKNRPWEVHKYSSKKAQDDNLNMLIDWISQYEIRSDNFSKSAHHKLFDNFNGMKTMYTNNQHPHNK